MNVAAFSGRVFMIPRELPSYLSCAYTQRFKNQPLPTMLLAKIAVAIKRVFQLIGEIITYRPSQESFNRNTARLKADFEAITTASKDSSLPIAAYCVSDFDNNGSILGDPVYYYHHHKIAELSRHYAVVAKVVTSSKELFDFTHAVKAQYPTKEIELVDFVTHGSSCDVVIEDSNNPGTMYNTDTVQPNEFSACAKDAVIILDACQTGAGPNSFAQKIAQQNPGKRVIAPGKNMFFSKPIFSVRENKTRLEHLVHGFAIFCAFTAREFSYPLQK